MTKVHFHQLQGSSDETIARALQFQQEFKVGVVTNVPVSHATPAAAYANNVSRKDYQDLSRDLLGLPSSSHRLTPLAGVDVLIGGGWGEESKSSSLSGMAWVAPAKISNSTQYTFA